MLIRAAVVPACSVMAERGAGSRKAKRGRGVVVVVVPRSRGAGVRLLLHVLVPQPARLLCILGGEAKPTLLKPKIKVKFFFSFPGWIKAAPPTPPPLPG